MFPRKTITSVLFLTMLMPSLAHAAVSKKVITKPTRGNYESVHDETAMRRKQFTTPKEVPAAKNVSFTDLENPLRFTYPDTWKATANKTSVGIAPIFDGYSFKTKHDSFIGLSIEPTPNKKDYTIKQLNGYFQSHSILSNENLLIDWYIPSFNLVSSGSTMLMGHEARQFTYTGERASITYQYTVIFSSFKGNLYTAYYTSKPETFDENLPVFESVLKALKVVEKKDTPASTPKRGSSR